MIVLGAVMTKVAQQYDITIVFCEIGIPVLGMLVLLQQLGRQIRQMPILEALMQL